MNIKFINKLFINSKIIFVGFNLYSNPQPREQKIVFNYYSNFKNCLLKYSII